MVGECLDIHDLRQVNVFCIADLIDGMLSAEGLSLFIRLMNSLTSLPSPSSCTDFGPTSLPLLCQLYPKTQSVMLDHKNAPGI